VRSVRGGRRAGRGEAGDGRAEAEFLERESVDFSGGLQTLGLLEILHGGDGGVVPLAGGFFVIDALTSKGLLDFLDAGRLGSELAAGARGGVPLLS
jgi:hypothetical protein